VFAWVGLRISVTAKDPFGKRLAAGLTALICGQAVINLCAVMGLAPLTGVPLPFVSYGNSSLLVMLAATGLLLNIARGGQAATAARSGRGAARLRVVDGGRVRTRSGARPARGRSISRGAKSRDSRGRNRGARSAGARRRRRASG